MLDDGEFPLMLECGLSWKKIREALNFQTSRIAGVLVTHEHKDHSAGVKDAAKAGMDIFTSKGTAAKIGATGHRVNHVKSMQQFMIKNWTILPFDTVHDAAEPLGFLIQSAYGSKILFLTDSSYCKYKFTGVTTMMLECNFSDEILEENIRSGKVSGSRRQRLIDSHFSLDRVKRLIMENDTSKLQGVYLLHLSDHNSDEDHFKREIQQLTGVPVYVCGA